jgi:phospholipase C
MRRGLAIVIVAGLGMVGGGVTGSSVAPGAASRASAASVAGQHEKLAAAETRSGIHKIRHVVIIMQENRSFDTYFGTYPGADGIPPGTCVPDPAHGGCVAPFHDSADRNFGGPHAARNAVADRNGGLMDGFVAQAEGGGRCSSVSPDCSPCQQSRVGGHASRCVDVMGYHDAREIPNYWRYAHDFVLQDHMFESVASWSLPEHLFNVSEWSGL